MDRVSIDNQDPREEGILPLVPHDDPAKQWLWARNRILLDIKSPGILADFTMETTECD